MPVCPKTSQATLDGRLPFGPGYPNALIHGRQALSSPVLFQRSEPVFVPTNFGVLKNR